MNAASGAGVRMYQHEIEAVALAIREARRCPLYTPDQGEPCDGLDGCEDCLKRAAKAALQAAERLR